MIEGRSLWELVERRADATPDATMALDEEGRTLTFAGYKEAGERAAAGLSAMGLGEGDVVSWQLPTWLESLTLVAALSRLGTVQNPILPIYRAREVGFVVRQAQTKVLIVPGEWRGFDFGAMANEIAGEVDALDVMVVDRDLPEGDPAALPPAADPPSVDDGPVRWLFYTSGTTADPKGARHTDPSIAAIGIGMSERLGITDVDRAAMVFPFTHIGGITWLFASLQTGAMNLMVEAFDPATTVPFLARNGVTGAGAGTPFHMAYLAAQREQPDTPLFPDVSTFPGGGAPKPPQLHYDIKAEMGGAGIVSGYGLTEAPILTMCSYDDDDEVLAHTEGRPMRGVELRLVDLDEKVVGSGEEGEVRAKAPQMMKGYLDESLDGDAFDDDGWFRTGDLGRQDEAGNLVITGRLKDIIIRKGENVSAKEVEDLLFTHPKVGDAAVIGLPDAASGERVCAVVVAAEGDDAMEFPEMVEFLKGEGLRMQAIPEQLESRSELPRNPTGKVLKHELRDEYAS